MKDFPFERYNKLSQSFSGHVTRGTVDPITYPIGLGVGDGLKVGVGVVVWVDVGEGVIVKVGDSEIKGVVASIFGVSLPEQEVKNKNINGINKFRYLNNNSHT